MNIGNDLSMWTSMANRANRSSGASGDILKNMMEKFKAHMASASKVTSQATEATETAEEPGQLTPPVPPTSDAALLSRPEKYRAATVADSETEVLEEDAQETPHVYCDYIDELTGTRVISYVSLDVGLAQPHPAHVLAAAALPNGGVYVQE